MTPIAPLPPQPGGLSVCINGNPVYGVFAQESQAMAVALKLKRKCRSSNVTVFDDSERVHFCVSLPAGAKESA